MALRSKTAVGLLVLAGLAFAAGVGWLLAVPAAAPQLTVIAALVQGASAAVIALLTLELIRAADRQATATRDAIASAEQQRVQERAARQRELYTAALLEQSEQCRQWWRRLKGRDPELREVAADQPVPPLTIPAEPFEALLMAMSGTAMPGALTGLLLWLMAEIRRDTTQFVESWQMLPKRWPNDGPQQQAQRLRHDLAYALLDSHQVIVRLLQAHADADDSVAARASGVTDHPWVQTEIGPHGERSRRYANAPPWPTDPAYADTSPEARDRESGEAAARQYGMSVVAAI
jgi:hypothetical protein